MRGNKPRIKSEADPDENSEKTHKEKPKGERRGRIGRRKKKQDVVV